MDSGASVYWRCWLLSTKKYRHTHIVCSFYLLSEANDEFDRTGNTIYCFIGTLYKNNFNALKISLCYVYTVIMARIMYTNVIV